MMHSRLLLVVAAVVFTSIPLPGQSPLDLLREVRGTAPEDYLSLSQEASRLWEQDDTAGIAAAYARLTEAYSWNGEHWWRLGIARYLLGENRTAAEAFRRADELGVTPYPQWNAVYAARAWARAGEPDSALFWLEKAVYGYRLEGLPSLHTDQALASLHEHPRFREIVRFPSERRGSREEGWRGDLNHLLAEIRRMNAIYSRVPLPDTLVQAAARLRERIPSLSDVQIAVELQHLLVLLGHNHNTLYLFFAPDQAGRLALTQLPLRLHVFPDGIYIVGAEAPHEDLVGARVLHFDESSALDVLRATEYVKDRENEVEVLGSAPEYLVIPQVLHALGLTRDPGRVSLTVLDRDGRTRTVVPEPVPQRPRRKLEAPQLPGTGVPPIYLSRPDERFWYEHFRGNGTVYLQFNQVSNTPEETWPSLDGGCGASWPIIRVYASWSWTSVETTAETRIFIRSCYRR